MFRRLHTVAVLGLKAIGIVILAASAQASFVTNGGFETNTGSGELGYNTVASSWSTTGYNFIFQSGTADTTGSFGLDGTLTLWGPNNGSNNGLPASSPDGGYFIGMDGDFGSDLGNGLRTAPVTQTLTGLTPGNSYVVSFWWAAAQQEAFSGDTQQSLQVGFGSSTQSTATIDLPSHGFSGWMQQTFTFTADGTSDLLSFLAVGSPALPPFLLLDGVTVDNPPTPEPASVYQMVGGLTLLGIVMGVRSRRSRKK
jgi:hypothetical protein